MFARGFYNAAQAMIVRQRELDTVSNNVTHVNTSGFRKDEVTLNTFMDELIWVQRRNATHRGTMEQTYVEESHTFLEQGSLEYTESKFDVAIWGNVYFNVTDRNGITYQTRAGQFELDREGYLVLGRQGRVQGVSGDIYIGHNDFIITNDGVILDYEENFIDEFLLTYIPEEANVRKVGDNFFAYDGDAVMPAGERFDIIQGAFEKSNVDVNKEMTKALEVQRMFEASSFALKAFDLINSRNADMAKLNR
ncbi:MAG: flagellar hook-basal body complex protein [Oscillospiraceae bacterium]|nr:flagellar hook-basal body complex protein [Oscillospiraceae bacterium]